MKLFRMFGWILCLSLCLAAPAHAGWVSGKVLSLAVRSNDGLHVVVIDGVRSAPPACATHDYFLIADEHSDAGKAQLAMLLSAYMSGKSVRIDGTGTCTRWPDGEDILVVTLS